MEPIVIKPEQFSDNPGNNYLQFLLSFAVRDGSTDIYFCIGKDNVGIYRNTPKSPIINASELEEILPFEAYEKITEFSQCLSADLEQKVVPEGFLEEVPVPKTLLGSMQQAFQKIYRLENLNQLCNLSPLALINVGGTRIWTGLSQIPKSEGSGYHMKLNYFE